MHNVRWVERSPMRAQSLGSSASEHTQSRRATSPARSPIHLCNTWQWIAVHSNGTRIESSLLHDSLITIDLRWLTSSSQISSIKIHFFNDYFSLSHRMHAAIQKLSPTLLCHFQIFVVLYWNVYLPNNGIFGVSGQIIYSKKTTEYFKLNNFFLLFFVSFNSLMIILVLRRVFMHYHSKWDLYHLYSTWC